MKTYFKSMLLAILFFISVNIIYAQKDDAEFAAYINSNNHFALNKALSRPDHDVSNVILLLSKAHNGYYFNKPEEAIGSTISLVSNYQSDLGAENSVAMTVLMAESYGALGEYATAASIYNDLLPQLEGWMDITSTGYEGSRQRYAALADVPPQKMILNETTVIPTGVDKVKLLTVPVKMNKYVDSFVFDAGAGYSIIYEGYAKEAGIRVIDHTLSVAGFSELPMKIGVADEIMIGDVVLNNVLFLINPEKIVFPEVPDYEIKGIIGLHAMRVMNEIQVYKNHITIPKTPTKFSTSNMLIDDLVLKVEAFSNNDTLLMIFDNGAVNGGLNVSYYNKHKLAIEQTAERDSINMGGLGGSLRNIPVFKLKNFPLQVGGGKRLISTIDVSTRNSGPHNKGDGVIGLDYIKLFDKMIVNFNDMYITFE